MDAEYPHGVIAEACVFRLSLTPGERAVQGTACTAIARGRSLFAMSSVFLELGRANPFGRIGSDAGADGWRDAAGVLHGGFAEAAGD